MIFCLPCQYSSLYRLPRKMCARCRVNKQGSNSYRDMGSACTAPYQGAEVTVFYHLRLGKGRNFTVLLLALCLVWQLRRVGAGMENLHLPAEIVFEQKSPQSNQWVISCPAQRLTGLFCRANRLRHRQRINNKCRLFFHQRYLHKKAVHLIIVKP